MTGGGPLASAGNTSEIYIPSTNSTCSLPDFPFKTAAHTQDGLLHCGGEYTRNQCHTFKDGTWKLTHTLKQSRNWHASWTPKDGSGTFLLGGTDSKKNSAIAKKDGTETPTFPLKYDT